MYRKYLVMGAAGLGAAATLVTAMPINSYAATSWTQRKKIIVSANVMDSFEATLNNTTVTRAQFAKMLVRASSYNNSVSAYNDVSVYPDVAIDHPYASYIRICAEQGWMSAYLGGKFKPDEPIKFHEAVRGCLALLGYTDESFTGNQVASRVAKAQAIGLSADIAKTAITESLDYQDCVNLFYNLMITNTAGNETATKSSGTIYGKLLGFELGDNNEINMLDTLEGNLIGPYLLKSGKKLSAKVPFLHSNSEKDSSDCSFYLNGNTSSRDDIEEAAESDTVLFYYNSSTKAVYAYSTDGNNAMGVAESDGGSYSINYSSSNIMVPSSITLSDGTEYAIKNSDMQYAFSLYGSIDTDDTIYIVWQYNSENEKEVVAYVQ